VSSQKNIFFATCAPGVEPVLHEEIRALRLPRSERQVGGVYFEGGIEAARRANLWLRTAIRVLMRVQRFACGDEGTLYAETKRVPWESFLQADGGLVVDAQSRDSSLSHSRFIEQRVKDAIVDRFREKTGRRPNVDREAADLGVHAHLFRDRCTLSVDTSGHALHRRGWRKHQGRAPLAETLAAAVLKFSGWDERAPLLDPFCGSATIPIEAALMAAGIAPGLFSQGFGFENWPGHDTKAWEREKSEAHQERRSPKRLRLHGTDRDKQRIGEARENAAAAGVGDQVELEVADAREFAPRRGWNAWIASNLPYGERIDRGIDLEVLYERFGDALRTHCEGYHVALLCPLGPLTKKLGLRRPERHTLLNGGLDCRLLCAKIDP
jgi:putative N6-adenine-specific DNA methylase